MTPPLDTGTDPRPATAPECICGLDESPDGARSDIVCPKHDGPRPTLNPSEVIEAAERVFAPRKVVRWRYSRTLANSVAFHDPGRMSLTMATPEPCR